MHCVIVQSMYYAVLFNVLWQFNWLNYCGYLKSKGDVIFRSFGGQFANLLATVKEPLPRDIPLSFTASQCLFLKTNFDKVITK